MRNSNAYDRYWKTHDFSYMVKQQMRDKLLGLGYKNIKPSWNKAALERILKRHDRGLLCYEYYTFEELQQFAANRHVSYSRKLKFSRPPNKQDLISALEAADEQRKFRKFLDLPPELRVLVYEFHVASFPETLSLPCKPPISRTCRLLRQEVLPVFYSAKEFEFHLCRSRRNSRRFIHSSEDQLFLVHLDEDAAHIRKLKLVLCTSERTDRGFGGDYVAYRIDLGKVDGFPCCEEGYAWRGYPGTTASKQLRLRMQQWVRGLNVAQGKKVLSVKDIHGLRRVVESA